MQDTLRLKRDQIRIYTGCDTLISPKFESIYNKSVTPFSDDALKFHRDFDGLRFLKYFILLTDTNDEKAPHYLIKNSASKAHINFWGDKRFNKNQILKHFKDSSIKKFEGPKGLNFLEDTSNYHSGSIPKDATRILITILFIDSNSAKYKSTSIARKYFEESLRSINKISIAEPYICFNLLDDGLYNNYGEKISIFNNSIK